MLYQRIFWLDDSPNFFDRMEDVAHDAALPLDISALLKRTTFSFDLEMAVDVVSHEQFDLYILDGDFPNRASDKRRASLDAYIAKVRSGPVNHRREYPKSGDHENNVNNNGFIFYEAQHTQFPPDAKVLMHSMSLAAPVLAYIFDLPIYAKNDKPEEVAECVQRDFLEWRFNKIPGAWQRFLNKNGVTDPCELPVRPQADLRNYEYGGRKELIERYLL